MHFVPSAERLLVALKRGLARELLVIVGDEREARLVRA